VFRVVVILLVSICSAALMASPLPSQPHVYVEGSGSLEIEPDAVVFSLSLEHKAPNLEEAKKEVDRRSLKLIELCKELGVPTTDIGTTSLRATPSYAYIDNSPTPDGTIVSRDIEIHLRDLSKYPQVMEAFTLANVSRTQSTRLVVSNQSAITDKALEKAMEDAHARAELLASSAGKKLGEVYSISEFQLRNEETGYLRVSRTIGGKSSSFVESPDGGFNAGYAQEPFEPGMMVAKAQVFVVYLLE